MCFSMRFISMVIMIVSSLAVCCTICIMQTAYDKRTLLLPWMRLSHLLFRDIFCLFRYHKSQDRLRDIHSLVCGCGHVFCLSYLLPPICVKHYVIFYLSCCQLALCVKHTVAGCRAGKKGKRNLNVGFTFSKM